MRFLSLLATILLLSACKAPPFTSLEEAESAGSPVLVSLPVRLNASPIKVLQIYEPPGRPPHVEDLFRLSPAEAIEQWAEQQLIASPGSEYVMNVEVLEASVVETEIVIERSAWELWEPDTMTSYDATLQVAMKLYHPPRLLPVADLEIMVTRSVLQETDATLEEKDILFQQLLDRLMNAFELEARRRIALHFDYFIES